MNYLKFKYKFWRLKKQYRRFLIIKEKYNSKSAEKRKFVNFFIKDEEDRILNKKVLNNFDKQIQKFKFKLYRSNNKINKLLFSLGIVDLNFIGILYEFGISKQDAQIIKEIFKNRINS